MTPPDNDDTGTEQPAPDEQRKALVEVPAVVAIGASAGGLPAIQALFDALPTDTGLAFVVVQHMAAEHESMLAELVARRTAMPVAQAAHGTQVAADHVYVIPPDHELGIEHGELQLVQIPRTHAQRLPIDYFFKALAADQGNRAIGVVLSGTGADGTLGIKAIKAQGGITFAQDEASAQYPDMPRSAARTGYVDFVLSPTEMAAELTHIAEHPYLHHPWPEQTLPSGEALDQVFYLLRRRTGHDFSNYKPTTIKRRIQRRMSVHQIQDIDAYVQLLQERPTEVDALFQDLLINVTGFFRDPEAFGALKQAVFPAITHERPRDRPVRIWVPGCSTGEEAYSVAMALIEYLGEDWMKLPIQVFATDIDEEAINTARNAVYPETIAADVSPQRLERFFFQVTGGYQVHKSIRDLCVFAVQDVVQDPPFSRIDLICCRNLLIYLDSSLQRRVLDILHFALDAHGFLMLGTAESVGSATDLFALVDHANKIYSKRATRGRLPPVGPPVERRGETAPAPGAPAAAGAGRRLQREAEDAVLNEYAPPGVLVDAEAEILAFIGNTGPYISPAPGRASHNLYRMGHHDLSLPLRRALSEAAETGERVRREGVRVHHNGDSRDVNLVVRPLHHGGGAPQHYLVILEERAGPTPPRPVPPETAGLAPDEKDERIQELEHELETTREQMQSFINDQVTTNEELQTANEEVQSANEELQSTNEELESAKEELQSTNEELATVNSELEARNAELSAANSDLQNLLRSVHLGMVMVGEDLRIRRFTPRAQDLLNLIDSDVGRPLTDIRPTLELPDLSKVIREVIEHVGPRTLEAQDDAGHYYDVTIRPYKTQDNRIAGAVLVFYDVTDIKQDPQQARRLAAVVRDSADAILLVDLQGRILAWNQGAAEHYGYTEAEALKMTLWDLVPPAEQAAARDLLRRLVDGERLTAYQAQRLTRRGGIVTAWGAASPLRDENGQIYASSLIERDLSELDQLPSGRSDDQ